MFINRTPRISAEAIEGHQSAADQVTAAMDFINERYTDLDLEQVHPWQAPDKLQLQLAFATTAYICDRTAELLYEKGKQDTRFRGTRISEDIGGFAEFLSATAEQQLATVADVESYNEADIAFSEEAANSIHPVEFITVYWPRAYNIGAALPAEGETPWQGDDEPEVTSEFIRGIFEAANEFHAFAAVDVEELAAKPNTPPNLVGVRQIVQEQIIAPAEQALEQAHALIFSGQDLEGDTKAQAYQHAYTGFINMSLALLAIRTPQVLGPDFFPQR